MTTIFSYGWLVDTIGECTGPIKLGGVCPYTICSAYMEIDWIEVTTSDN